MSYVMKFIFIVNIVNFCTVKGVAPSPTHQCSRYLKGSLRVALDDSRQLSFFTIFTKVFFLFSNPYIYIYIYIYI